MLRLIKPLILASTSPRRSEILNKAGIEFTVKSKNIDEIYPIDLPNNEVAPYLSKLKAHSFLEESNDNIILASDTIVILEGKILGKPKNEIEAIAMLKTLSGKTHDVISGVCILSDCKSIVLSDQTKVSFKSFSDLEIDFYVKNFKPFDKAGSYGVQEWLGAIGIEKIEGSFYNVMGLPIHLVYSELQKFSV